MMGAYAVVAAADVSVDRILDAATELMSVYGLTRWSMDDVATRAAVGRTSVYRTFGSRDQLVHAVLARELRTTITRITEAAAACESVKDGIIEGALVGLAALRGSLVETLLRSDPSTVLPFLTTKAGPLVALTRQMLAAQAQVAGADLEPEHAAELAEVVARLGLSFILTRDTAFPVDDGAALRASLRRLLEPVLGAIFAVPRAGA
jgi:AcrR family transcriptional regulator